MNEPESKAILNKRSPAFNIIVDITANFAKAIFPYVSETIKRIRKNHKTKKNTRKKIKKIKKVVKQLHKNPDQNPAS